MKGVIQITFFARLTFWPRAGPGVTGVNELFRISVNWYFRYNKESVHCFREPWAYRNWWSLCSKGSPERAQSVLCVSVRCQTEAHLQMAHNTSRVPTRGLRNTGCCDVREHWHRDTTPVLCQKRTTNSSMNRRRSVKPLRAASVLGYSPCLFMTLMACSAPGQWRRVVVSFLRPYLAAKWRSVGRSSFRWSEGRGKGKWECMGFTSHSRQPLV